MLISVTEIKVLKKMYDNKNIVSEKERMMSLLSRYYHRKYMYNTLTSRMSCYGTASFDDVTKDVNEVISLISNINETYESATSGFFASSGQIVTNPE